MEDCAMTSLGISGGNFDPKSRRSGLTNQQVNILYEAIQPGHPANPWASKAQLRNCMIVNMVLATGMRRSEFLSLRISDIDFGREVIVIRRRSDTPDDPHLYRSNVARSRVLPIHGFLARLVHGYIRTDRRELKGSQSHDYLLVSIIDGSPLSGNAFNDIFSAVRDRVPGMPLDFRGNLCRHTWNDRMCGYLDLNGRVGESDGMFRRGTARRVPDSSMAILYIEKSIKKRAEMEAERSIRLEGLSGDDSSEDPYED
jgi:integrase